MDLATCDSPLCSRSLSLRALVFPRKNLQWSVESAQFLCCRDGPETLGSRSAGGGFAAEGGASPSPGFWLQSSAISEPFDSDPGSSRSRRTRASIDALSTNMGFASLNDPVSTLRILNPLKIFFGGARPKYWAVSNPPRSPRSVEAG